tara:strand:- start:210 stop:377 length:168 start_codon:yes stop_codon:yes gene_type:complete
VNTLTTDLPPIEETPGRAVIDKVVINLGALIHRTVTIRILVNLVHLYLPEEEIKK